MLKNLLPETCARFLCQKFDLSLCEVLVQEICATTNMADNKYSRPNTPASARNTANQSNLTVLVLIFWSTFWSCILFGNRYLHKKAWHTLEVQVSETRFFQCVSPVLSGKQPLNCYLHVLYVYRIFSLDHLDDYQKHFTVMNYRSDAELKVVRVNYYSSV